MCQEKTSQNILILKKNKQNLNVSDRFIFVVTFLFNFCEVDLCRELDNRLHVLTYKADILTNNCMIADRASDLRNLMNVSQYSLFC